MCPCVQLLPGSCFAYPRSDPEFLHPSTQVTRHLTPNSRRIVLGSSQCRSPESSVHGGNFFISRGAGSPLSVGKRSSGLSSPLGRWTGVEGRSAETPNHNRSWRSPQLPVTNATQLAPNKATQLCRSSVSTPAKLHSLGEMGDSPVMSRAETERSDRATSSRGAPSHSVLGVRGGAHLNAPTQRADRPESESAARGDAGRDASTSALRFGALPIRVPIETESNLQGYSAAARGARSLRRSPLGSPLAAEASSPSRDPVHCSPAAIRIPVSPSLSSSSPSPERLGVRSGMQRRSPLAE